VEIRETTAEISRSNNFSKWRPSAILDLLVAYLEHPRRALVGPYRCTKFGCNRSSSFSNMKVLIFCTFGLKTPIHAPKLVFRGYDPLNGVRYQRNLSKGTSLGGNTSYDA